MNDLRARVHAMSMDFPSRDVGSRGEELASESLADELYGLGLQTDIDEFTCPGNIRITRSIYLALIAIGGFICLFAPSMRVLAIVLSIAGAVLAYLSFTGNDVLKKPISSSDSQNVIARYVPEGLSGGSRRTKIVITAHYDVKKPSVFQMPALRKAWKTIRIAIMACAVAVPVCCIICILPIPATVSTVFAWIGLVASVVVLLEVADLLVGTFLKTPKGANNNASGMAVLCEFAKKIATAEVRKPEDQPDGEQGEENGDIGPEAAPRERETAFDEVLDGWTGASVESTQPARDVPEGDTDDVHGAGPASAAVPDDVAVAAATATAATAAAARTVAAAEPASTVPDADSTAAVADAISDEDAERARAVEAAAAAQAERDRAEAARIQAQVAKSGRVIPRKPGEPSPREARLAQVAEASSSQVPAASRVAAPREHAKPSWWTRVEDDKKRGDFDRGDGEPTLRSRFADAPASRDYTPTSPEPVYEEEQALEASEPVEREPGSVVGFYAQAKSEMPEPAPETPVSQEGEAAAVEHEPASDLPVEPESEPEAPAMSEPEPVPEAPATPEAAAPAAEDPEAPMAAEQPVASDAVPQAVPAKIAADVTASEEMRAQVEKMRAEVSEESAQLEKETEAVREFFEVPEAKGFDDAGSTGWLDELISADERAEAEDRAGVEAKAAGPEADPAASGIGSRTIAEMEAAAEMEGEMETPDASRRATTASTPDGRSFYADAESENPRAVAPLDLDGIPAADSDSTISYTPRPVYEVLNEIDENIMSMKQKPIEGKAMPERPEPYQEDLVEPVEDSAEWPTGSYQYSRNQTKYRREERRSQPSYDSSSLDPETDVLDFSRERYENAVYQRNQSYYGNAPASSVTVRGDSSRSGRADRAQGSAPAASPAPDDEAEIDTVDVSEIVSDEPSGSIREMDDDANAALDSLSDDFAPARGSHRMPDVPKSDNPAGAAYRAAPEELDSPEDERQTAEGQEGGRTSLLNLPIVGSKELDSNLSMADDGKQTGLDMSVDSRDGFISREDEMSSSNLTGAFAPLGASGIMQPVTAEMLEQYNSGESIYVDDADDATENFYSDEGSYVAEVEMDMPKHKFFGRRKKGKESRKSRRSRKREESSANEWLGVDEGYNATEEGAKIGSWDNFSDDPIDFGPEYSDDAGQASGSVWDSWDDYDEDDGDGWRGGAYGGTPEQNRDAIDALSDDLLNKEVWFVALGASGADSAGMDNLLRTHADELKHARIINIESVGVGDLCFTASEELLAQNCKVDSRMQKLVHRAGKSAGVKLERVKLTWRQTEATHAIAKHKRAITITALDDGVTPGLQWSDDTDDAISEENLQDVVKVLTEIVKAC